MVKLVMFGILFFEKKKKMGVGGEESAASFPIFFLFFYFYSNNTNSILLKQGLQVWEQCQNLEVLLLQETNPVILFIANKESMHVSADNREN